MRSALVTQSLKFWGKLEQKSVKAIIYKAALISGVFYLCQAGSAWSQPCVSADNYTFGNDCQQSCVLLAQESGETGPSVDTSTWNVVNGNGFKVRFPGEARHNRTNHSGAFAETWETDTDEPLHMFKLQQFQFSGGSISTQDPDEFLFANMENNSRNLNGKLSQRRRIQNDRYPGCTYKITTSEAEWDFMIRLDGDTVYTLSVCSMPYESDDGYSKAFFDSFKL